MCSKENRYKEARSANHFTFNRLFIFDLSFYRT